MFNLFMSFLFWAGVVVLGFWASCFLGFLALHLRFLASWLLGFAVRPARFWAFWLLGFSTLRDSETRARDGKTRREEGMQNQSGIALRRSEKHLTESHHIQTMT